MVGLGGGTHLFAQLQLDLGKKKGSKAYFSFKSENFVQLKIKKATRLQLGPLMQLSCFTHAGHLLTISSEVWNGGGS